MTNIPYVEAKAIDIAAADDATLQSAWHSYAGMISYHHADDSGREWDLVPAMLPRFNAIETEICRRGLPRPTGNYLMSNRERIDWEATTAQVSA